MGAPGKKVMSTFDGNMSSTPNADKIPSFYQSKSRSKSPFITPSLGSSSSMLSFYSNNTSTTAGQPPSLKHKSSSFMSIHSSVSSQSNKFKSRTANRTARIVAKVQPPCEISFSETNVDKSAKRNKKTFEYQGKQVKKQLFTLDTEGNEISRESYSDGIIGAVSPHFSSTGTAAAELEDEGLLTFSK